MVGASERGVDTGGRVGQFVAGLSCAVMCEEFQ
jgi:hypothetical protein